MLTPPNGVFKINYPAGGGTYLSAVPQREWGNFCQEGDAAALQATLNAQTNLGLALGAPFVDPEQSLGYVLATAGQPCQLWALTGTLTPPGGGTPVPFWIDPVGSFLDRQTNPDPFLDRNPDTSLGGPVIALRNYGSASAPVWGLCWTKD
jgi:hypothetical protein